MKKYISLIFVFLLVVAVFSLSATAEGYISASVFPNDGGTISGAINGASGTYTGTGIENEKISLTANPSSGYLFSQWTVDGSPISGSETENFNVFDNQTRYVVANFVLDPGVIPSPEYVAITTCVSPVGYGSVTGGGTIEKNLPTTFAAIPETGYRFSYWEQDGKILADSSSTITLSFDHNSTITAHFEEIPIETYSIQVFSSSEEMGSVSGGGHYKSGDYAQLSASPNPGYAFSYWLENNGEKQYSLQTLLVPANKNQTLVAYFYKKNVYSVSASPENGGTATVQTLESGDMLISAKANPGFSFDGWYRYGKKELSNEIEYLTSDGGQTGIGSTYIAKFVKKDTCDLIVCASPESGGSVTGTGTYEKGKNVLISASPASGYQFDGWYCGADFFSSFSPSYVNVSEDKVITAKFSKIEVPVIQYRLNVYSSPNGAGTVSGSGLYTEGASVPLVAIPNEGYSFIGWLEGNINRSEYQTYYYTIHGNADIIAQFVRKSDQRIISAVAKPLDYGNVYVQGSFVDGTSVMATAEPKAGYKFDGWYENGILVSTERYYQFIVDGNRSLEGRFSKYSPDPGANYSVTAITNPAGLALIGGTGYYKSGSVATMSLGTPLPGYLFTGWSVNGKFVSSNPNYSFTVVGNTHLVANYTAVSTFHTITYLSGDPAVSQSYTQIKYAGIPISLYDALYTKKGSVQTGWKTVSGVVYPLNATFSLDEDITLYPVWGAASSHYITVNFNAHGNVYQNNTTVTSGQRFLVKDDSSLSFSFIGENKYYPYNIKLNGYSKGSYNYYTVQGKPYDQTLYIDFESIYGAPKTGDDSDLVLWTVLGLSAMLCSGAAIFVLKKKEG